MSACDCETSCISHLLSINGVRYSVGLFKEEGLFVKDEWLLSIHKNENDGYDQYKYNMKTKELKMSKRRNEDNEFVSVDTSNIESSCVVDVSNNGLRFEGSFLNDSPLGSVCLMNASNELIYRGVMIGDKKECFGIEFYPDLGKVEYIGCYCNDERHGFGMLYDRKGELLYEGDWWFGSNDFERNQKVILKDINNDRMVHSLIHELVVGEGVGNYYKGDLLLCGYKCLERIVVKNDSLNSLNSLRISDNPVLKSIEIEDRNRGYHPFGLDHNYSSFQFLKTLMIKSLMIYD